MSIFKRGVQLLGAVAIAGVAVAAQGQTPCQAGIRELSNPSARIQLQQLKASVPRADAMVANGAGCLSDSVSGRNQWHQLRLLAPMMRVEDRSGVPDPRNSDGAWAGDGLNAFARVGFAFDHGIVHATVAPEFSYAQNQIFNFFHNTSSERNPFASNWYGLPNSIDLPSRFGRSAIVSASFGQSALWVSKYGADLGVSSSSQAWGPGIRGQLLLGADAPGIPRIFVRTNHPVSTPIGSWSGTAFLGTLTESPFFDQNPANDLRTLSAWNIAWNPGGDLSNTVIGFAHANMRSGSPFGGSVHKLTGPSDVMNSLYARVRAPDDLFRAWVEIARAGALPSAKQFLTVPYQGLAYLVGLERGVRLAHGTLLFTAEAANLEQPTAIEGQATQDFYTSNNIAQGWTQRGQVLGDGIGPGGQSQWVSADWVMPRRSIGIFVERVRWNEDAFLRQYLPYPNRPDVTIQAGVRGGALYHGQEVNVELTGGRRLNYLFQNGTFLPAGASTVEISVMELRLSVVPFVERGR